MADEPLRVNFRSPDRRAALAAAQRFLNAVPEHVAIDRGTSFRRDQSAYVDVTGDRGTVDLAMAAAQRLGVTLDVEPRVAEVPAPECLNCGNVPDVPVAVCPACDFREIEACPWCGAEVPRTQYRDVAESVHQCPNCSSKVRLSFAEPLFNDEGLYVQPLVRVKKP